jgi:hypothetical protein
MGLGVIESPADWSPAALEARRDWIHQLTAPEIVEVEAAFHAYKASGRALVDMEITDFSLDRYAVVIERALKQLEEGPGVFMIRGFPVERYSADDMRIIYWGIGKHLGVARSQSTEGDVIGDVRDLRLPEDSPRFRGYKTAGGNVYHCDTCDVTGLFVLCPAKLGGVSHVASTVAIHNEIARRRPDLLSVLYQPFIWSMQGQEHPGDAQYYEQPIFTLQDEHFSCRYMRPHIRQAQRRFAEVPRLTKAQEESLDLIDALVANPEFHHCTNFQPGDLQLVNNHVTLHARTPFEDYDDPTRRRHLLRMWLSVNNSRPLSPLMGHIYRDQRAGAVRGGFIPHDDGAVVFETLEM